MKKFTAFKWSEEHVQNFWDYESNFPANYFSNYSGKAIPNFFKNEIQAAQNILDYGCGDGTMIGKFLKSIEGNKKIFGYDSSPRSVEVTNEKHKDHPNFGGAFNDIKKLKSATGSGAVDCIFILEVVEHLYDE